MSPEPSPRTHARRTGDVAFAVAVLAGYAATLEMLAGREPSV